MSNKPSSPSRTLRIAAVASLGIALALLAGMAIAKQDKYAVKVPGICK